MDKTDTLLIVSESSRKENTQNFKRSSLNCDYFKEVLTRFMNVPTNWAVVFRLGSLEFKECLSVFERLHAITRLLSGEFSIFRFTRKTVEFIVAILDNLPRCYVSTR